MSKDPVCDMEIDEKEARSEGFVTSYNKQEYFFCSAGCKREFDLDPETYVTPGMQARDEEETGGEYPGVEE